MADKNKPSQKQRTTKRGRGSTIKTGNRGARKANLTDMQLALMGKGRFQKVVNAVKNPR